MATVAFIGLGNMGGPMAANLAKAGHVVRGFDLSEASRQAAAATGVAPVSTLVDATEGAGVVITMLPAGTHVIAVWSELVKLVPSGTLLIDCSTIDVATARSNIEGNAPK